MKWPPNAVKVADVGEIPKFTWNMPLWKTPGMYYYKPMRLYLRVFF
jgi:hypothetical protein